MLHVPSTRTALLTSHVSMAWESTMSQIVRGVSCTLVTVRSVGRHCLPVISACHGRLQKHRDVHSVTCTLLRTLGGQRGTLPYPTLTLQRGTPGTRRQGVVDSGSPMHAGGQGANLLMLFLKITQVEALHVHRNLTKLRALQRKAQPDST